jgi:hypothetical protein
VSYQGGSSRYYVVKPLDVIAKDKTKVRCSGVHVMRELGREDQDGLAGMKLWEANHPVNPLLRKRRLSDDTAAGLLKEWVSVRDSVGASVWASVRDSVWASVGASVWDSVWASVRDSVWASVWASVRDSAWASVWAPVGASVGDSVRDSVGAYIGGLFPAIKSWRYAKQLGSDPWRPLLRLWYGGLLPSYVGKTWRLHAGPEAEVVMEMSDE